MQKALVALIITLTTIVAFYVFVPFGKCQMCRETTGRVISVYAGAKQNICLKLKEGKLKFRFGAHASQKLNVERLRQRLMEQQVRIIYHDAGSVLAPYQQKEIAELQIGDQILYKEELP